jgi:pyrroloquinoline quinone biosynthesis protein E
MNLLEMIKQKDVRQFVLNGGEPLLYPNIVPLLKQISGMEISVNIFTSGYGLTKEIINILKIGKNINFYISLNGSTQKINSQSREGYEYAINAVMMLAAENAVYGINWVARHDNTPDFANMISLCREYNAYIPFSYR